MENSPEYVTDSSQSENSMNRFNQLNQKFLCVDLCELNARSQFRLVFIEVKNETKN